jgi:O-acetyl-ADP-ribose deacetylase (regulator of RNase III)
MELPQFNSPGDASAADHQLNDPIPRIAVVVGDITALDPALGIDAIVNAAKESLTGGGGVDGAIHEAAGWYELVEFNKAHHPTGCPTGLAKRTPAFALEKQGIQHIIHTVGPIWSGTHDTGVPGAPGDDTAKLGYTHEDNLLASCYMQVLTLAAEHNVQHLAIPAISTGVYRFPKPRAARIAFGHAHGHLLRSKHPERITFACFSEEDASIYHDVISTRGQWMVSRGRV